MTSRDFCYWLQGFFEVSENGNNNLTPSLTVAQVKIIRNHLNMVFVHEIDPSMGSKEHQSALQHLHGGGGFSKPPKLDASHVLGGSPGLMNC